MKNLPLIIGVILVIAVAAGGYFFMQNRSASETMGPAGKKMAANGGSQMMSLKELMNLGSSQMCTFSYSGENGSNEGVSYISDNRVRTDFTGTDTEGNPYEGGMIMDREYMYTWSSQMDQGFKMAVSDALQEDIEEEVETARENPEAYQQQIDPNEEVEYSCSNWSADESKFTPPSDITFSDFTEQMQQYQQMMPSGVDAQTMELREGEGTSDSAMKAEQCAACDQAGESAAACRQALGC